MSDDCVAGGWEAFFETMCRAVDAVVQAHRALKPLADEWRAVVAARKAVDKELVACMKEGGRRCGWLYGQLALLDTEAQRLVDAIWMQKSVLKTLHRAADDVWE